MRVLDHGAGEDVLAAEGAFGVAVLAGLRGADLEDLAGLRFEDGMATFAESVCLAGKSERSACVAGSLVAVSMGRRENWEGGLLR
jgi:hypothetical protein